MEPLFERAVREVARIGGLDKNDFAILEDTEAAANELVTSESEKYLERKYNPEVPKILKSHNLLGVPIQKRYGGRGSRQLVHSLFLERLGQVGMGVVTFADVHQSLVSLSIQDWGNEEQKERILVPATKGESLLAFGLTEPGTGSDPASLTTSFEERGGRFVLSGQKMWISNGSIADRVLIFAYPKGKREGMCAFLVDAHAPGFAAKPIEDKLGLPTSDTATIYLDKVEVPKGDMLGPRGRGSAVAYSALLNGRIGIGSGCLGVMEDCLNLVKERAASRVQHGKLIGRHQLVQRHIAFMASSLEASRWLVYRAAMKKDEYEKDARDLALRAEADRLSALAKFVASRGAFESADRAIQVFGASGYSTSSQVARHFLDTRVTRIYEGTDEIMELKIASAVLGKDFEAYK